LATVVSVDDSQLYKNWNNAMATLNFDIPASIATALDDEAHRTGKNNSSVVSAALAQYLRVSLHSLFQISTSGSLVMEAYSGAISVKELLSRGFRPRDLR
jgi:acetolactate decarboxylase